MYNLKSIPLFYYDPNGLPTWMVLMFFFSPLAIGIGLYMYKTRYARLWRKGVYPPKNKLTEDNLLEAYLALGSLLILLDYGASKSKTQFINQYFNRYFKNANYNFGDSLLFSMRHPIQVESVCDWFNRNLASEGERSQVVYFLTGLAMLDGVLSEKELQFLKVINDKLKLKVANLERTISIYKKYHESKKTQEKSSKKTVKSSNAKIYAQILHISESATFKELKSSYRKLVKEHHPDKFAQASEAQQLLAKDEFQKIQEAYEYWLDRLS